jgi:Flp pilus assembly pilin Flp
MALVKAIATSWRDESGTVAGEYVVLAGLVVGSLVLVGVSFGAAFDDAARVVSALFSR